MRKVLIITYYFPPIGYAGSLRVIKFIKYLPEFGWIPTVLTSYKYSHIESDPSLIRDVPERIKVYRVPTFEFDTLFYMLKKKRYEVIKNESKMIPIFKLMNFFLIPDSKIFWFLPALSAALKLTKIENFDVIFSTAPPLTNHLIAISLKALKKIPVVADYRDAWYEDPYKIFPTIVHRKLLRFIEGTIVKKVDAGISVLDSILQNRIKLGLKRGLTIENGYDPDDYKNKERKRSSDKLIITYAGTLSYDVDPVPFFMALRSINKENQEIIENLVIKIFSTPQLYYLDLIKSYNLEKIIRWQGYIPHSEIAEELVNSDVLLVLIRKTARYPYVSQSKLYEYIGSGKVILGVLPKETEAWKTIASLGNSFVVTPDDPEKIKEKIIEIYELWRNGGLKNLDETVRKKFSRREQAKQLAKILDEVTK